TGRRPAWRIPERWFSMSAITSRFTPATPVPWRLLAAGAALLLALLAGLVLAGGGAFNSPAPPYGLAANGPIAYAINGDIVVAEAPGVTPKLLVGGATEDRLPLFSLDGSRFVFLRGPNEAVEVWAAKADGSDARRLTEASSWIPWIDWSPDSRSILLTGLGEADGHMSVVRVDGTGSATFDTGLEAVEAGTFRPTDGAQVSFRGRDARGTWGFYLANRDGSGLVRLELDPGFEADQYYAENSTYYFNDLTWSSTGTRIAFHTLEPDPASPAGPGYRIHVADIDAQGGVSGERTLEFDASMDDEFGAQFIPGTSDLVYQTLEGTTHRLFRGSTSPGAGPARDLGITGKDWIFVTLAPDGTSLLAAVPDRQADADGNVTRHVVQLDLASLQQTPLSMPEEFSWQRKPNR
ncbi:MAG TPA: hypothetical protein VL749_06570, partial [Patescibacteria group bacterium]|nr:hypothetical protein [Patescibacteria group bacterium]